MGTSNSIPARVLVLLSVGTCAFLTAGTVAVAAGHDAATSGGACSTTSRVAHLACRKEAEDDYWIAIGICVNLAESDARSECRQEARDALDEAGPECREQYVARQDVCEALGQSRYSPAYGPADFVDPFLIGSPAVAANPYLPLQPGTQRTYRNNAAGEEIVVSVTRQTIEVDGVECVVVHDLVIDIDSGDVIEDTDDFFAQDLQGNVWYFGEVSREYEEGLLVSLDGSWRAGIDGAKAGILMKATPQVGDTYRQEFALGEAEDLAKVINLAGSASSPYASCAGTCLVTKEFTPVEPDVFERKYYKPGIGQILGVDVESGEREVLINVADF